MPIAKEPVTVASSSPLSSATARPVIKATVSVLPMQSTIAFKPTAEGIRRKKSTRKSIVAIGSNDRNDEKIDKFGRYLEMFNTVVVPEYLYKELSSLETPEGIMGVFKIKRKAP